MEKSAVTTHKLYGKIRPKLGVGLHHALQSENKQMFGYVVTISLLTMALDHNKILFSNSIVKILPFEWKDFLIIKTDSHSFNLNKKRPFVGIRSRRIYKRPG